MSSLSNVPLTYVGIYCQLLLDRYALSITKHTLKHCCLIIASSTTRCHVEKSATQGTNRNSKWTLNEDVLTSMYINFCRRSLGIELVGEKWKAPRLVFILLFFFFFLFEFELCGERCNKFKYHCFTLKALCQNQCKPSRDFVRDLGNSRRVRLRVREKKAGSTFLENVPSDQRAGAERQWTKQTNREEGSLKKH